MNPNIYDRGTPYEYVSKEEWLESDNLTQYRMSSVSKKKYIQDENWNII